MEHRAVRRGTASEMMPPDDTLKSLATADANYIDAVTICEHRHEHLIARLRIAIGARQPHFPAHACGWNVGLLIMTTDGLVHFCRLLVDKPELDRFVSVGRRRFALHHDTRSGLD